LASGTWEHREDLDAEITSVARDWRIERMPTVDRNVLRLGAFELLYTDLPKGVVLDQAVELAKAYSTSRSPSFVNGVLDAIADGRESTRV
ncbi:MAG: transcription antitermination factor NusB, partial [Acidimicrobiia bacterium]